MCHAAQVLSAHWAPPKPVVPCWYCGVTALRLKLPLSCSGLGVITSGGSVVVGMWFSSARWHQHTTPPPKANVGFFASTYYGQFCKCALAAAFSPGATKHAVLAAGEIRQSFLPPQTWKPLCVVKGSRNRYESSLFRELISRPSLSLYFQLTQLSIWCVVVPAFFFRSAQFHSRASFAGFFNSIAGNLSSHSLTSRLPRRSPTSPVTRLSSGGEWNGVLLRLCAKFTQRRDSSQLISPPFKICKLNLFFHYSFSADDVVRNIKPSLCGKWFQN